MAHIAFIAPPFLGHINPMRALARELVRRGHAATFVGIADMGPLLADDLLEFRPVGLGTHPAGHLRAMTARMAAIDGFLGLPGIIRDVSDMTALLCRELPAALRECRADLLCCDGTEAAGGLVAGHLGLPVVTVANALPLNREPKVPPAFTGWRYDPTPWGVERNRGGHRVADLLMRRHGRVIADAARAWRLGPKRTVADCLSPFAEVSQTVAGFDFPRAELPDTFHHVGPLRDAGRPCPDFELPTDDGRPLVYASLGTLQGGRLPIFRRIASAAERLGLRLVIAHGGRLRTRDAAELPGSPEVHSFVPQDEVLAHADVAVLNGGLNTVMDALAHAVPVVAVPIAFEQGAIAARLARTGAGRAVSRRLLTAGRMTRAINSVRTDGRARDAARRLGREIAAAGGVSRAADIVETVLRTGRPVTRGDLAPPPDPGSRVQRSAAA